MPSDAGKRYRRQVDTSGRRDAAAAQEQGRSTREGAEATHGSDAANFTLGRRHRAAVLALAAEPATAQDYPNRTVTIVAPSAPGGMYSILARLLAGKLEQLYGKSFIVENRPGASSVTGAVSVIRAPADGYTLMVATS